MGHYRSEMASDAENAREVDRHERWMRNRTAKIEKAIAERGIARVLAEIIEDGAMASIRFNGHDE